MASRRIVGFAVGEHHDAALATAALRWPSRSRAAAGVAGVVFHSDQGNEYTAATFRAACGRLGVTQSMGRVGSALDNAVIESWHSTVEFELRMLEHFTTKAQARSRIAEWIEEYNHDRRHSSIGMISPVEYELALRRRASPTGAGARGMITTGFPNRRAWPRPRRDQGHALRVAYGQP